jgi:hypothetical protein
MTAIIFILRDHRRRSDNDQPHVLAISGTLAAPESGVKVYVTTSSRGFS